MLAPGGTPIPNAALDVWQSDAEGLYDLQMPDLDGMALRGIFHTNLTPNNGGEAVKRIRSPILCRSQNKGVARPYDDFARWNCCVVK